MAIKTSAKSGGNLSARKSPGMLNAGRPGSTASMKTTGSINYHKAGNIGGSSRRTSCDIKTSVK